ncbi:uncharacterized protein BXZ73DRAFT_89466 [Epithele typhae]|uniref:uncharacterized protein n=1 Tax=Epithele typhae TaxID=378194 RepID=UPI0020087A44|nr:uncharacterized protein BXZ73DRAFT_89466 [Epithele typhae]KAH9935979.1 hypothetical protein BXZ73DRAFT_89466 [Epithele typhae]
MVFNFSFSLAVPGITNPFTAAAAELVAAEPGAPQPPKFDKHFSTDNPRLAQSPRRRRPSPSPLLPVSRKRGWVPSNPEPSRAAPIHTSTSGYLDTPSKYREMAEENDEHGELEELVVDLPPPKRRRTLAGSIISTALSAALIGTAVGLTVYRLWRDRGKGPEALPPPPYEQGEWVPPDSQMSDPEPSSKVGASNTPRNRKARTVAYRRTPRHRKTPSRPNAASAPHTYGYASSSRAPIPPEFDFASGSRASPKPTEDADPEEQMSWIGDRLTQLISEGQKALGKEVVIMSEDQQDEEDDGSGAWVEEDEEDRPRSRRRNGFGLPPYSPQTPLSPHTPTSSPFDRGLSVESDRRSIAGSLHEDESSWQTPEMKASMERARALYNQKRGH